VIYGWSHHAPLLILGCLAPMIAFAAFTLERTLILPASAARQRELDSTPVALTQPA